MYTLLYRKVRLTFSYSKCAYFAKNPIDVIIEHFSNYNTTQIDGFSYVTDSVDWITVKIPGTGQHQTVQDNSWILTNLSSASSYECIVQVREPIYDNF
jgi:hypothetical protein